MDFKTAMEHVRNGTATEEERRLVDSEVDKYLLITEHLDAQWEKEAPPTPEAMPEMKQLHAKLRRRNVLLILTCLLLVAAIAAAAAAYISPKMEEKQQEQVQQQVQHQLEDKEKTLAEENAKYRNPDETTYPETLSTDLNLILECYNELHLTHYRNIRVGSSTQTGIGTYQLSFYCETWGNPTEFFEGTLEKNVLTIPLGVNDRYSQFFPLQNYIHTDYAASEYGKEDLESCRSYYFKYLPPLPDYVKITADIAFPEKLSMEQLLEFKALLESMGSDPDRPSVITWVGICNGQTWVCGMKPFTHNTGEDPSEEYPYLRDPQMCDSAENLEQHFKSLLKFSQDQIDLGREIVTNDETTWYYDAALDYVEENGVYTYGCKIVTTPQILLELMERDIITFVNVLDYWISA